MANQSIPERFTAFALLYDRIPAFFRAWIHLDVNPREGGRRMPSICERESQCDMHARLVEDQRAEDSYVVGNPRSLRQPHLLSHRGPLKTGEYGIDRSNAGGCPQWPSISPKFEGFLDQGARLSGLGFILAGINQRFEASTPQSRTDVFDSLLFYR
jgi:hypothetical protein